MTNDFQFSQNGFEFFVENEILFNDKCTLKLIIQDGIEIIGPYMFSNTPFEEVRWPLTCEEIPMQCFAQSKIERIINIANVKEIGEQAFKKCKYLKSLDLSQTQINKIGKKAFIDSNISSISLPETLKVIGESPFMGLTFSELIWPGNCDITAHCFNGAIINSLIINEANLRIHGLAFLNADIKCIKINGNICYIMNCAFFCNRIHQMDLNEVGVVYFEKFEELELLNNSIKLPYYILYG